MRLCVVCLLAALTLANKDKKSGSEKSNVRIENVVDRKSKSDKRESMDLRSEPNSSAATQCINDDPCFHDKDCLTGKCEGVFAGTCDCSACVNFHFCANDSACGGLYGACDLTKGYCNCIAAFNSNGFKYYSDAVNGLCNVKECNPDDTDPCFGLPCNPGHCVC